MNAPEQAEVLPAASVALARKAVVVLLATEAVMPGEAKAAAEPWATEVPAVQPAVLNSFTVEPAAAEPFSSGALSLAGELGSLSVICGAAGAWVSTVKDRETIWLSFPGASIALTEKVWAPSESSGLV